MSHQFFIMMYLVLLVLISMVPAYVMFSKLPKETIGEKTEVKGVVAGFNINLTGGFAGFFAVLLIFLTPVINAVNNELDQLKKENQQTIDMDLLQEKEKINTIETWQILGNIDQATDQAKAFYTPPGRIIQPGGKLAFKIYFDRKDLIDPNQVTPIISISQDGFATVDFTFNFNEASDKPGKGPYRYEVNKENKTIKCFASLIKLNKIYKLNQNPLTPVTQ
jgi:hypothetical protein